MSVFVVTVTYGNRFHLLKQVIDAALSEGVSKVIVVDNNSDPESREKLREYEQKLGNEKIKVLYLDDNYGSAGGFKRGLGKAYNDPNCEFIWLLDEDNTPNIGVGLKLVSINQNFLGVVLIILIPHFLLIFKQKNFVRVVFVIWPIRYFYFTEISRHLNFSQIWR